MDSTLQVNDEVFVRADGRRATVTHIPRPGGLYILDGDIVAHRHEFIPVKWGEDRTGNTGIGVCAKNGSTQQ